MVGRSDRAAKIISRSILLINSDGKIALLSISGLNLTLFRNSFLMGSGVCLHASQSKAGGSLQLFQDP